MPHKAAGSAGGGILDGSSNREISATHPGFAPLHPSPGAEGEGIAVMTDDGFAIAGPDNSHNIKARIPAIKFFAAHKPVGRANQKLLLPPGDGGFGRGEFLGGARADFHKHHVIII